MEKILQLYTYVDGGIGDTPFPNAEGDPIEIGAFRYDAKRMGGAPIITASVNYPSCLDNEWTDNVYAEFNGEKYFLKQTPTSSYDNQDSMYKHEVELVSERVILDNVYFYDAVASSEKETSPIIGNLPASPEWQYFGNIDISKDYTTFSVRQASGFLIGIFDVVFDEAIRIVSGPPIDMRVDSSTGDIYVYDNYSYLQAVGLNLVFSYIDYDDDKPVSNSTKVVFFGDIREFASRLQSSLEYRGLDYTVVVDDDVISEEKLMSFEDQFFSNVLQEIYNTYEVPYYFVGKTIHIGFANEAVVPPTFSYGVDDALLSITKNNANFKVVNRVTGTGSSDNIPFYYPNNSPKGEIDAFTNREELKVKIIDHEVFCDKVEINKQITYRSASCTLDGVEFYHYDDAIINDYINIGFYGGASLSGRIKVGVSSIGHARVRIVTDIKNITNHKGESVAAISVVRYSFDGGKTYNPLGISEELFFDKGGDSFVNFDISIRVTDAFGSTLELLHLGDVKVNVTIEEVNTWDYDGKNYNLKDLGLDIASGIPQYGDTISQVITNYIKTAPHLMPSIYRETNGEERFYNAVNGIYDGLEFKNPYIEGRPKEHIITVEDVKPTIKDVKVLQPEGSTFAGFALNSDMFTEFAYDRNDNDETEDGEDENSRDFKHSYFFGKLRVLDFNLFDHAIENQPMTVSFTSGDCGACNFTIGVTEEFPQKNPVQVDDDGNLIYDEKTGNVVCGVDKDVPTFQERQQDTSKYEVWIALKKEEDTYGILMPKAPKFDESGEQMDAPYRPKSCTINEDGTPNNDGDTFVILGINLPKSYILNAEKKLEEEIIKYLKENNEEKFTFSIGFSRIYFEENPDVLQYLNENSRLNVTYNGKTYLLYITSYSYQMSEGNALPQITVELDENLTVSQNALQNAISEVKSEVGRALSNIDVLALSNPFFIRKDIDDVANGKINFVKGIKFGEGGKVEVMDNNSAKLTIEYLEVTKKASFTSLEIKEKTHVGGQIVISPAAMTCGEVEELDEVYRCYFQTRGEDNTDEIFNQFAINDLAICQTYNSWGSRYYWRKVVGIGEDYIDLSKTIFDEDSDIPMAGDKIVQLGNTEDITRQAAQVLSAYGEDAPSFIMYNGINDFSLADKNITGIAWNPNTLEPQMYSYGSFFFGDRELNDNFITFQKKEGDTKKTLTINADVTIGANSSGLTNLAEWKEKQAQIDAATQGVTLVQKDIQNIQDQIDGVVENHFYEGVPTNDNFPAIQWTTEEDKANHIGDTYVNIASEEQDPDNAGKAWRWAYTDNEHTGYHWHPIADTDAVKALLEAYKAQAGIDDLQYLKGTFAKSVDVDGVVMSEMVAVKDGDEIKAFLNGSDIGKDSQHGKLLIAAGVSDISDPSTAATKIYEDGRIEVDAPTVNGKVIISDDGFTYYDTSGSDKKLRASMGGTCAGASGVFVAHDASEPNFCTNAAILAIGGDRTAAANFHGDVVVSGVLDARSQGVWCNKIESPYGNTIEIVLPEDEDFTRVIRIPYGMIEGLRPKTRVLTNAANSSSPNVLTNLDHSVFVNLTSGTCYIALPQKPQDGQEYYIESRGANMSIKMYQQGYSLYSGNTAEAGYSVSQTGRALLRFKFYSDANLWVYSWLNRNS